MPDSEIAERNRHLRYEPITENHAAVDWAVSMADRMAHSIHVTPLNADDMREPSSFQSICDAVASMTDQERGAMRRDVVPHAARSCATATTGRSASMPMTFCAN